jgi:cold shock CspA family protein
VEAVAAFQHKGTQMESRRVWTASPDQGQRESGVIVNWGIGNTYGFIRRHSDPGGRNLFVHASELEADVRYPLDVGTRVSFTVQETEMAARLWAHGRATTAAVRAARQAQTDQAKLVEAFDYDGKVAEVVKAWPIGTQEPASAAATARLRAESRVP